MKKILILTISILMILSINSAIYGVESKNIKAEFTVIDVIGTSFKEIKITPYRLVNGDRVEAEDKDGDGIIDEDIFTIYLPTGYYVEGTSATYVADRNDEYPFTVYYKNNKETFTYKVKDIDNDNDNDNDNDDDDDNDEEIYFEYELMYEYEKKQLLFHVKTDSAQNIKTHNGNSSATNEIIYSLGNLENNTPFDFYIMIENKRYDYKVIRQGEYYLLIAFQPSNNGEYSRVVKYSGYNFTNNNKYLVYPSMDIYYDNGSYEVIVKSELGSSQSLFNFNITGMDFRKPNVDIILLDNDTFELELEDDFSLGYMITFDGKYVPITDNTDSSPITYNYGTEIKYNGDYIFQIVDKAGNRTVKSFEVDFKSKVRKPYAINYNVHGDDNTKYLFKEKGQEYKEPDKILSYYENILPAYMTGSNNSHFNPDSYITRGEIVTIFCRITDLPFDTSTFLKTKFTDIENHWARDYISMGSANRYISGYKDNSYRPDNNVTRAEFSEMLTKISAFKSKLNALPAVYNYNFSDISNHWAESQIIKIARRDLVQGSNGNFYPDKFITRSEVVHAINKLYGFNPTSNELNYMNSLYDKYYNFMDIKNHKYYNDIIISVIGMYKEIVN